MRLLLVFGRAVGLSLAVTAAMFALGALMPRKPVSTITPIVEPVFDTYIEIPPPVQVRTISFMRPAPPPPSVPPATAVADTPTSARRNIILSARAEKVDICQRHNMRKVMTGRYSWRCRKNQ